MTFSARMIFRSFSADSGVWGGENRRFAPILILEKSVSGSEILPVPIEFPLDAKKWSDIRSYPFLTELDRRFWGTSGIRSVSIEGKVRCWFLRRFVRAEFDSGKIPYWFDAAGFGSLRGCSDVPDTGKTEVSKFTYLIACKCYVAVRFSGCFRPAGRIRLFSNIGCGQR